MRIARRGLPDCRFDPFSCLLDHMRRQQRGIIVDGSHATYEKTSDYEVRSATLAEYREGETAEGTATNFATLVGRITETIKEHGFYISRIDLGNLLHQG